MLSLPQALARLVNRPPQPAGDRTNADLAHELMLELEDEQPNPLLMKMATGFPSALLCVLAAGVLAGALAGQHVGQPLRTSDLQGWMQAAAPAAQTVPDPASRPAPRPAAQPPLGDAFAH